ncbi:LuxR C-terminal-related transcriptional regulator [Stappia sp. P2PMeth1]|uniref:helix-turn-helix transcriptional regulator n=1 Tax=Stappia sp. P2PMeth1 TaxID=2003586 RepID=UPI001645C1E0|nr:LuxR C-terminal-related transcriptional regulator [Stappia sp. P2PMeth1]
MTDPAKFNVVLELAELSQGGLGISSSSLLALIEGMKTACRHGEHGDEVDDRPCLDDRITLNFHLVVDHSQADAACPALGLDLTRRQTEIAHLLERGLTNKEIANKLNISPATVKNHVHAILGRLHLDRRSKVAAYLRARSSPVVAAPAPS